MKSPSHRLIGTALLLLALTGLAGCSGSGESDDGAGGDKWAGPTSHGGTVNFTMENEWITTFQVTDNGASIWIQQPARVVNDTFEAHNSENGSAPGAPGATVAGVFDSAVHCTGSYTLTKSSQQWTGTYTASKQ